MGTFEFQSILFNFHDVILLMTVMQCLFFSALLYVTNTTKTKSTLFLAAFLFAHALIPANELMMWGAEFKYLVRHLWPSSYFIPTIAYYLDAAILFFCIKHLVFKDFELKRRDFIHLLPAVVYILFITFAFYGYSFEERQQLLLSESFVYSPGYVSIDLANKILRVCYAIGCIVLITRYSGLLEDKKSNIEKGHINWLQTLVTGFIVVMTFEAILAAVKVLNLYMDFNAGLFMYIGLTGNYTSFILVTLMFFLAIRNFMTFEQVKDESPTTKTIDDHFVNPEMAEEIETAMLQTKAYMDPDITLDKLADELKTPARDLSMLINRHFGVNFYEFVNKYRIEEAKKMLIDPKESKTTITDIYLAVGFNSKSVFYTFFKKFEGMTPSKYRQLQLDKSTLDCGQTT
ncbi:helix-turn-helix domain-containing protein [Thalassotalea litorea]|uniref:helix-turn-helix domain-containing protein n=1 Tax=Thalassotalea litorea TaxID=2020715 RepID=UPI0037362596